MKFLERKNSNVIFLLYSFYLSIVFIHNLFFFRYNMPPKKKSKTRSDFSCIRDPPELPDKGSLYTLREVLSAIAFESEAKNLPLQTISHFGTVEKAVRHKFMESNPRLPLITEEAALKKIGRDIDAVDLLDRHWLSAKRKKNLLSRLDKIFDLVTCQCEILECSDSHGCSGAHVICNCPPKSPGIPDIEAAWLRDQRLRDG